MSRRLFIILAAGLLLGGVGYGVIFYSKARGEKATMLVQFPELTWLRKEFHLDEAQLAQITSIHKEYLPRCKEMCRKIQEEQQRIDHLLDGPANMTPELKSALGRSAELRADCQERVIEHCFEISRCMPPVQGRRYLKWVKENTLVLR